MENGTTIPNDLQACQAALREALETNHRLTTTLEQLRNEVSELRKFVTFLTRGHRSEKRIESSPNQAWLPFQNDEEFEAARAEAEAEANRIVETFTVKRKARRKKRAPEGLPAHLRREEQIVEAPESVTTCPEHGERKVIDYDVTETLVYERPEMYVLRRLYPKYTCPSNPECGVSSPERPTSLVEGDRYSPSVAAAVIDYKWGLHLPFYREQDLFAGSGWTPSRSTLLNIVKQAAFVLAPLVALIKSLVQQDFAVGIDDTNCRMVLPKEAPRVIPGDAKSQRLAEKYAEARSKGESSILAKMWAYSGLHLAPYDVFDFRVSRHRDGPDEFFAESNSCYVVGDCFSGNTSLVIHSEERLRFVACWAHARRKFTEAVTYQSDRETMLGMLGALFDIEERGKELSWEDRTELRQRESQVVLTGIRQWIDSEELSAVMPKCDFSEALNYLRNHWDALNLFTTDGRLPIDNNHVERLMKTVALGRKAWLFVSNVAAGEMSAQMMTLASSARRHDLDVWMYLRDVLQLLLDGSTDYTSMLPDVWKQSHPQAIREYRTQERIDRADRKKVRAARRRLQGRVKT